MLTIDGSQGEGGGQILRTSLALALITGQPFRIERIRAGRPKPGLARQHLTCVVAAQQIGGATVDGAAIASQALTFIPGQVRPGAYRFPVGSAGSTTLVLQTVLPALLTAAGPTQLTLEGGTHNPHAPPFDFLAKTFLPLLNRMGPTIVATLQRPGFYPAGGGRLGVSIEPAAKLERLDLLQRGDIHSQRARAVVAGLDRQIAERELAVIRRTLGWKDAALHAEELDPAFGPGNVMLLEIESENVTEVITGFGQRGIRAEDVARRAAAEAQRYLDAAVPVSTHLADQLLLPLALAGGGSFVTLPPTDHARTNAAVIRQFLGIAVMFDESPEGTCRVTVGAA